MAEPKCAAYKPKKIENMKIVKARRVDRSKDRWLIECENGRHYEIALPGMVIPADVIVEEYIQKNFSILNRVETLIDNSRKQLICITGIKLYEKEFVEFINTPVVDATIRCSDQKHHSNDWVCWDGVIVINNSVPLEEKVND
ncbi:MAG TPA: hypothetical protein VMW91_10480 [Desulfosporosinus sp.]|nr:hypothetical protein [Desulfosporosinus sp.]